MIIKKMTMRNVDRLVRILIGTTIFLLSTSVTKAQQQQQQQPQNLNQTTDYFIAGQSNTPWQFSLQFGQVALENQSGKTAKGSLKAQKATRNVEGDAVRLTWKPKGVKNEWGTEDKNVMTANIINTQRFANLLPYQDRGVLLIDIKVNNAPNKNVDFTMECNWDWQCRSSFPLKNALKRLPKGEWAMLPIPLSCFKRADFDLSKVTSPFMLYTGGKMDLEINNVRVVQTENPLSCG
ncbi:putative glycoside hydrolase [Thalassotalea litorea]|uniref:putative glycoside hydrolase n=1 Tax=Thalassotalea litorea TaxID=2020715 RepID=UPI003735477A